MTDPTPDERYRSPLLDLPGAVAAPPPDSGTAWHYGDPLREQRVATTRAGVVDRSDRDVLVVPGPDRLEWLHAITSQHLSDLADGGSTEALVLSPNGHVEQHWNVTELDGKVWIDTEPGAADEVLGYLLKMRFLKRVEPAVVTAEFAVLSVLGPDAARAVSDTGLLSGGTAPPDRAVPMGDGFVRRAAGGGFDLVVPRRSLADFAERLRSAGAEPVGVWADTALRIEARRPRLGVDTDHRTIPHEVGWIGPAVHLDKGCYRGQETVARVQNMGKPPRRLVVLHLSGDGAELPPAGTAVERDGRPVGFVGSAAHHFEAGPIALAVVKRGVTVSDPLTVGGQPVALDPADAEAVLVEGFAGHRND
jgi:folate-binding protein YgfZ